MDDKRRTPLHVAAFCGDTEVVAFLLDRGMDIEGADFERRTPLHLAIVGEKPHKPTKYDYWLLRYDNTPAVELLLDRGAYIEARDHNGRTPLHLAAKYGRQEIFAILIARGADLETISNDGETVFHLALSSGISDNHPALLEIGMRGYEHRLAASTATRVEEAGLADSNNPVREVSAALPTLCRTDLLALRVMKRIHNSSFAL